MSSVEIEKGVCLEVLGTCMTNPTAGSQQDANVEYKHLWSYAQEAALIAVSEKNGRGQYEFIADPERRAKRIAAHYADLYFKSAEKSQGKVQLYWVALAAFVVKDIVEAYRFAREDVLQSEWKSLAGFARNNSIAGMVSLMKTDASPYQHSLRTYIALAKGNLWLFMDIYPWMWFFLEYGIKQDGSLNTTRLNACLDERNWDTFHIQSRSAVEELPFGPNWLNRLNGRLAVDPVYKEAGKFFDVQPAWSADDGYGSFQGSAHAAHRYAKAHVKDYDNGYRTPPGNYWRKFQEAYYVMESEHIEMSRVVKDSAAVAALVKARAFKVTPEIKDAYGIMIKEYTATGNKKFENQQLELAIIAKQEQLNVLQPLIYNDPKLRETMAVGHAYSRLTGGWISPEFKVVYSASPKTNDPELESVFDAPTGFMDRITGAKKDLTNPNDRMKFVDQIARKFNKRMSEKRPYMEGELRKIQGWLNA